MLVLLLLGLHLSKMMVREEDIESIGEMLRFKFCKDGETKEVKPPSSHIEYFSRYVLSSLADNIDTSSLMDLACSGRLQKYIYTNSVLRHNVLYDDDMVISELLVGIGSVTSAEYLDNPYSISPKTDYYKKDEVLSDIDSIITLTKALDKKSNVIFFNLLDSKKISPLDYFDLLQHLGKNNYHRAFGYLGEIYYYGLGVPKAIDRAMDMYLKGKTGSDLVSYTGIGRILMGPEYEDYASAKNHFEYVSISGIVHEADYRLYELYTNHLLMHEYGRFHLSKSLNMGFLPALYKDGLNYFSRKDFASTCIRLEPLLDYTTPVNNMHYMANKYFNKKEMYNCLISHLIAMELGSKSSLKNAIYLLENNDLLEKQETLLFSLYMRQMREGINVNLNRIGDCYFYGKGVPQSYTNAFSYYLSSSVYKDVEGMINVAYMYEKGLGVKKSLWQSFRYLQRIRVTDDNYLLLFYLYISFFLKLLIFNKYIISTLIGLIILVGVFRKFNKVY